MLKIVFLVLGLLVGFGGGVYWAHHNPDAAGKLSEQEERRFLEAQLAITQKIQGKLDQLSSGKTAKPAGAAGFVSGAGPAVAADVNELKSDTQKQQDQLKQRIDKLKK